jgi:hypothetical protein
MLGLRADKRAGMYRLQGLSENPVSELSPAGTAEKLSETESWVSPGCREHAERVKLSGK